MKPANYKPSPVDTSHIDLQDKFKRLTEDMARNVHEVWAAGRIAEGWRFGDKRNDERKEHPCLVPYEQLSQAERDYDRNTAMETLKFILSKGYAIYDEN